MMRSLPPTEYHDGSDGFGERGFKTQEAQMLQVSHAGREVSDEGKDGDPAHSNATLLVGKNKKWQPMYSYIMITFRGSDFCIIHMSFSLQK